jgi:hypothetical protein
VSIDEVVGTTVASFDRGDHVQVGVLYYQARSRWPRDEQRALQEAVLVAFAKKAARALQRKDPDTFWALLKCLAREHGVAPPKMVHRVFDRYGASADLARRLSREQAAKDFGAVPAYARA